MGATIDLMPTFAGLAGAPLPEGVRIDGEDLAPTLLGAESARFQGEHPDAATEARGYRYYACWLAALERLLADKGLCPASELADRTEAFAARPPGHDHFW